ncbi:hypothetical protein ACB092_07G088300 [Castanea dentata]
MTTTARQKAYELSTLCDAETGLMVFSATGKLFEYASTSMQQVIKRHNLHLENLGKMDQLSLELQLENGTSYAMLSKEIEEKTHELRKIRGEELPGMDIEELQKLEKELEVGLIRVGERFLEDITALQQKVMFQTLNPCRTFHTIIIMFARHFRNKISALEPKFIWFQWNLFSTQKHVLEQGQSSESITNICRSSDPQDNDSLDISLKLG